MRRALRGAQQPPTMATRTEALRMADHVAHNASHARTAPQLGTTVYERYLRTTELLQLQKPEQERLHPDELTFQVVHQSIELWWKVSVQQLATARQALDAGRPGEAARALRRAASQQELARQLMRQLEFVSPVDFMTIRAGLENGSGMDSPGFRGILRAAPTLWDAFAGALERAGLTLVDVYGRSVEHASWYECAEALIDFDEQFHLFRAAHLKLAERHLGLRTVGTGGTPIELLERTLHDLLFPDLWAMREELVARAQAEQAASNGGAVEQQGGH
jgi:tryptophan 2,3-dioxygenase